MKVGAYVYKYFRLLLDTRYYQSGILKRLEEKQHAMNLKKCLYMLLSGLLQESPARGDTSLCSAILA